MRKLFLTLILAIFYVSPASAQFFGGLVSQGSNQTSSGSQSTGGSSGPGIYRTYGAAGSVAGSQAQAGVNGPGINFTSSGSSGVLSGSTVGGFSGGNAAGGSAAGSAGSASSYHAAGIVIAIPLP